MNYLRLLTTLGFVPCVLAYFRLKDETIRYSIMISAIVSILGFFATKSIIPVIKNRTLRAGLHGKDINKKGTKGGDKDIPESVGLASGLAFLVRLDLVPASSAENLFCSPYHNTQIEHCRYASSSLSSFISTTLPPSSEVS